MANIAGMQSKPHERVPDEKRLRVLQMRSQKAAAAPLHVLKRHPGRNPRNPGSALNTWWRECIWQNQDKLNSILLLAGWALSYLFSSLHRNLWNLLIPCKGICRIFKALIDLYDFLFVIFLICVLFFIQKKFCGIYLK